MVKTKRGVIVGRFQPFHNGHLEYLQLALEKCDFLYLGITTTGNKATKYEPKDVKRLGKLNNPFNYYERVKIINQILKTENIDSKKIKFVSFNPNKISLWYKKVPKSVIYYLLLLSEKEKSRVLEMEALGLSVEILKVKKIKDYSATKIREFIRSENKLWRQMVPQSIRNYLEQNLGLIEKLKQ